MELALLLTTRSRPPFMLILLPKRSVVGAAFMMFNILDCAHSVRKVFFPTRLPYRSRARFMSAADIVRTSLWRIPLQMRGTRFKRVWDTPIAPVFQTAACWRTRLKPARAMRVEKSPKCSNKEMKTYVSTSSSNNYSAFHWLTNPTIKRILKVYQLTHSLIHRWRFYP